MSTRTPSNKGRPELSWRKLLKKSAPERPPSRRESRPASERARAQSDRRDDSRSGVVCVSRWRAHLRESANPRLHGYNTTRWRTLDGSRFSTLTMFNQRYVRGLMRSQLVTRTTFNTACAGPMAHIIGFMCSANRCTTPTAVSLVGTVC